ncbi:MAG: TetR/AcrR family transcriptional regulator [Pseudomonadota bacterium]
MSQADRTEDATLRDQIIDATFDLLADRPFHEVTTVAIARHAGISLAVLAAHFPTRGHIIDAFARRIDQEVLAVDTSDMADEAPRERLFDVLMRRIDALSPYRAALASLMRAARRDLAVAAYFNGIEVRSQSWMLAAAEIDATGWRGRLAIQGLAVAFARVLRTFVKEDDPGMPRTMAALDKALRELESQHARFARVFGDAIHAGRAEPMDSVSPAPQANGADHAPAAPVAEDAPAPEAEAEADAGAATDLDLGPKAPDAPPTEAEGATDAVTGESADTSSKAADEREERDTRPAPPMTPPADDAKDP